MRLGALLSTITSILMLVNILSLTLYYVGALEISNEFAVFLGLIVFASIIPGLIFIIYWILATGNFKRYSPTRLWTGRIGIVLQLVGAIFWIVLSELIGTYKEVLFLYAAYLIIDITGYVLFAAMLIRLAGEPKINSKFRTTGIIYLLGGVLSITPYYLFQTLAPIYLLGWILILASTILIYVNSGSSLKAF